MESRYSSEHRLNVEKAFQYYVLYIWYTLYHFRKKIKNIILKSHICLRKSTDRKREREREREREKEKTLNIKIMNFYSIHFII